LLPVRSVFTEEKKLSVAALQKIIGPQHDVRAGQR
jgi:hypothetical protein